METHWEATWCEATLPRAQLAAIRGFLKARLAGGKGRRGSALPRERPPPAFPCLQTSFFKIFILRGSYFFTTPHKGSP